MKSKQLGMDGKVGSWLQTLRRFVKGTSDLHSPLCRGAGHLKSLHLIPAAMLLTASWSAGAAESVPGAAKVIQLPVEQIQSKVASAASNATRFALPIPASVTLDDGTWTESDGISTWKVVLTTPGAVTMSFFASDIALPAEARLLVTGKDLPIEQAAHLYKRGRLLSSIVRGDVMTVEIVTPTRLKGAVSFFIEEVQMGYKGILKGTNDHPSYTKAKEVAAILAGFETATSTAVAPKAATQPATGNGGTAPPPGMEPSEEVCYRNFSCYKDEFNTAVGDSVVGLIIANTAFCTGNLVHDASRSFKPFVLTANHCITDIDPARVGEVNFQWKGEAPCGSATFYNQVVGQSSTQGATLRMTYSDHLLYEASEAPPSGAAPYWLGFDAGTNGKTCVADSVGQSCSISADQRMEQVNHGRVLPRSAAYTQGASAGTLGNEFVGFKHTWVANNDLSVTGGVHGGASGSSLVLTSRTIGVLTGGGADCTSTYKGVSNPIYDRTMDAWVGGNTQATSLKAWLDPTNTGLLVQDGSRPAVTPVTPTVNLTLDRSSVNSGDSVTLTNRSTNAASCAISSAFTGSTSFPTDGSSAITVPSSTSPGTYPLTVECTSSTGNKASQAVNLTVTAPPPAAPTANFSLDRTSAAPGDVVVGTVSSTNATSCTLTSPVTATIALPLNGAANITLSSSAANGNYSLKAECTSSSGAKASQSAPITISATTTPAPGPTVSFSLDRSFAAAGDVVVGTVSSTDATSCTLTSPITSTMALPLNGAANISLSSSAANGTYSMKAECSSSSGTKASQSVQITIGTPATPVPVPTVSFSLDRASAVAGSFVRATLSTQNANSCTLSSDVTSTTSVPVNGQADIQINTSAAAGDYTIGVQCSNTSGGSTSKTVSLDVTQPVAPPTVGQAVNSYSGGGGGFGLLTLLGLGLFGGIRRKALAA